MLPRDENLPAVRGFDYSALAADLIEPIQKDADRIRTWLKGSIVDVGRCLQRVKDQLDHGQFSAWIAAEFGMSLRTAERLMTAAKWAKDKSDIVSALSATEIYLLSAPSSPKEAVAEITERVRAGEALSPKAVRELFAASNSDRQTKDRPQAAGHSAADTAPDAHSEAAAAQAAFLVYSALRKSAPTLLGLLKAGGDEGSALYQNLNALAATDIKRSAAE